MLNKITYTILLICFFNVTDAQLSVPFSIGGIRLSESGIGQLSYLFVDSGKCLRMVNGINLFVTPDPNLINKLFQLGCVETPASVSSCPITGYPNPTSNFVKIISSNCYNNNASWIKGSLLITDNNGVVIKSSDILTSDIITGYKVDLSKQSAGVYYVTVNFQNQSQTIKIVKIYGK